MEERTSMLGCHQSTLERQPVIQRNFSFPAASSGSSMATPSVNPGATPPLTIFFNGTVGIFHLQNPEQADHIMEMAERASNGESLTAKEGLVEKLREDLPLAKKRSLQRFLEKRKERHAVQQMQILWRDFLWRKNLGRRLRFKISAK